MYIINFACIVCKIKNTKKKKIKVYIFNNRVPKKKYFIYSKNKYIIICMIYFV